MSIEAIATLIQKYVERAKATPAGLSGEALDRAAKETAARQVQNLIDSKERLARKKTIVQRARSDETSEHHKAISEIRQVAYTPTQLQEAKTHLGDVVKAGNALPSWIDQRDLGNSNSAMEFAARIASLPPDLRQDPSVVYFEITRMYWSTDWAAATPDVARQTTQVIQKGLDHVRKELAAKDPDFGSATNAQLWQGLDHVDLYHTNRLEPLPSRTEPEDKNSADHDGWEKEYIAVRQRDELSDTLEWFQEQLDSPHNQNAASQLGVLENLERALNQGVGQQVSDSRVSNENKQLFKKFNSAEVKKYLDWVQRRKTALDREGQVLKHRAAIQSRVEDGAAIVWTPKLAKLYGNPDRKLYEDLNLREGQFTRREIEMFVEGGEEGQLNYIYAFLEKHTALSGEGFRENLEISQKWETIKKITEWCWGEKSTDKVRKYQEFFKLYEEMDGVLKAVLFRAKGPKPEESFKILRYISDTSYELLRSTDLIQYAEPALIESILGLVSDDTAEYFTSLQWLKEKIPYEGQQLSRAKVWERLFIKQQGIKGEKGVAAVPGVPLTKAEGILMESLEKELDRIGMGILLRDKHMLPDVGAYSDMKKHFDEYRANALKLSGKTGTPLGAVERADIEKKQIELKSLMQRNWRDKITLDKVADFNPDDPNAQSLLESVNRMSPVKIRARQKIIQALRLEGKTEQQILDMEPKIHIALWAAETMSIGKGEAMEKGARLGRAPGWDIKYVLGIQGDRYASLNKGWKYHMDRGFAEAYQRVLNDDLFADDFVMGGKAGSVIRDLYYMYAFELYGSLKYKKEIEDNPTWKQRLKEADRSETPTWVVYAQYAEEVYGIPFSELIRPNTLNAGLQSIASVWRDQRVVLEQVRERLAWMKQQNMVGADATSDFQALGIRLASATTDVEKRQIMDLILQRKTSALFTLVGGSEVETNLLVGTSIKRGTKEWRHFQDALQLVEMKLAQDDKFRWHSYDLMDRPSFDLQMKTALKAVDPTLTDEAITQRLGEYHTIMLNMKKFSGETTASGRTRIDEWAQHNWRNIYMIESTSFNWKDTDRHILDMYHVDRRMNDFNGMMQAADLKRKLMYNSDFYAPHEGKEADLIITLKQFRDTIEGYSGTKDGEKAQTPILKAIIDYNRDLAAHGLIGWIPLGATAFRNIGWAISPGFRRFCIDWKLIDKPVSAWPRSLRGLVSLGGDFAGAEANHMDEFGLAKLLESVERNHNYTDYPELLEEMKHHYKTGVKWRMAYGLPRKYGFAGLAATVAFAAGTSIEDQKKEH